MSANRREAILEWVSFCNQVAVALYQLSPLVVELCARLSPSLERAYDYFSSLHESDKEVRLTTQIQGAKDDVWLVARRANKFLDQVHELTFQCCPQSEMMDSAQRGVNRQWNLCFRTIYRPHYRPLNDLTDQLQKSMNRAGEYYEEFVDACNQAMQTCVTAVEMCKYEERKARNKKEATKVLGGGVIATGILTGVVGLVVAGPVGAVVAGGSAVATGIAAGTTYYLVRDFEQSQQAFQDIRQRFESVLAISREIRESIEEMKAHLTKMSVALDDAAHNREVSGSILAALDRLSKVAEEVNKSSARYNNNMKFHYDQLHRN